MATPESGTNTRSNPGLVQSIKAYFALWVDLLRTRLELFTTELEEDRERIQQIIILGVASFLCLSFGVALVTFFIVAEFWDTSYRLAVVGGLAFIYLLAGVIAGLATRKRSRQRPKLFSASLGELAKDYQHLSS